MTSYQEIETRFRRLGALQEAAGVLQWDTATLMPEGGAGARAEQSATLALVCHEMLTDPAIGDLLDGAERQNDLDAWQRANLREMRRRWRHAAAVPADLVEAMSRARSESETVWRAARPADDFAMALPGLERVLALTREVAAAKAEALGVSPYEALLDQYEPGLATEKIDGLFAEIARAARPGARPSAVASRAA
jgi:carboxypeptidase Taq